MKEKRFWIGLSLINLAIVALLGLILRSKILFPIPFLDYRNILSAHSHLAFSGWVGLVLLTFFIYDILPPERSKKRIYKVILWTLQVSAVGMAVSFPLGGYYSVSIFFSTLYIVATYVLGWMFFRDLKAAQVEAPIKWLSAGAVISLILSSVGPFTLAYIMATKSTDSLLYRDSIYTFLHLQYNGFFTLGVFAIFFMWSVRRGMQLPTGVKYFSISLLASVLPSLFVALLWHNLTALYLIAGAGCLLMLVSVMFFVPVFKTSLQLNLTAHPVARFLWIGAFVSFIIKMVLAVGTIYPPLGNAVYGARPIIIGFLHLVFLLFASFYLLSLFIDHGYFTQRTKVVTAPFVVFATGVLANEVFLMLQGLEILFGTNRAIYNWLLWVAAILLFIGAVLLAGAFYSIKAADKKAAAFATAS